MTWYRTVSPFGPIAYTVSFSGEMYLLPHEPELIDYRDPLTGDVHPSISSGHSGAIVVNGKPYTQSFRWSLNTNPHTNRIAGHEYVLEESSFGERFTSAAYKKVSDWLRENYASMATPIRKAQSRYESAQNTLYYAGQDLEEAQKKFADAEAEFNAALINLEIFEEVERGDN
jgi:hypothetical protein